MSEIVETRKCASLECFNFICSQWLYQCFGMRRAFARLYSRSRGFAVDLNGGGGILVTG
jgi:hypothetical protein